MINFNSVPVIFTPFINNVSNINQKAILLDSLPNDVFQRTSPNLIQAALSAQNVSSIWDEKRIQEVFDKTYDIVMGEIPIVQELNIKKPHLVFQTEPNERDALATYCGDTNQILISEFLQNDLYLFIQKDENGNLKSIFGVRNEAEMKNDYDKLKKKIPDINVIKLNNDEKELYVSSVLAHELRHCIQNHLVLSTQGCIEPAKNLLKDIKNCTEKIIELNNSYIENGGSPEKYNIKEEKEKLASMEYCLNYKPKKILNENTLLKFSKFPSDNRYWSVKEHFLLSKPKDEQSGSDSYYANPNEIDAFNYQMEFFLTRANKKKGADIRKDFINSISQDLIINSNVKGLDKMSKFGYAPIIQK